MFLRCPKQIKISKFQNSGLQKKKNVGIAGQLAENIQISCTGIPEIKRWYYSVFNGTKTEKSQNFKILRCTKKKNLLIAC